MCWISSRISVFMSWLSTNSRIAATNFFSDSFDVCANVIFRRFGESPGVDLDGRSSDERDGDEATDQQPTGRRDSGEVSQPTDLDFGHKYIEKYVQIPFHIPTPDDEDLHGLTTETRETDVDGSSAKPDALASTEAVEATKRPRLLTRNRRQKSNNSFSNPKMS